MASCWSVVSETLTVRPVYFLNICFSSRLLSVSDVFGNILLGQISIRDFVMCNNGSHVVDLLHGSYYWYLCSDCGSWRKLYHLIENTCHSKVFQEARKVKQERSRFSCELPRRHYGDSKHVEDWIQSSNPTWIFGLQKTLMLQDSCLEIDFSRATSDSLTTQILLWTWNLGLELGCFLFGFSKNFLLNLYLYHLLYLWINCKIQPSATIPSLEHLRGLQNLKK